jgi:cellulose synthase/poly-beta-1,6-N-acetylglucosamine synthase-like glycosyltransferase
MLSPALILAASLTGRLSEALFDDTFAGIHQLAWFDWALLIPYFALLGFVSFYGFHRYEVIRTYLKHRKRMPRGPAARFDEPPRVTVQLPIYNERYVVERLLEEVAKIDYPRERLQIQVLDDSTDETHPFTERLVNEYRAQGLPIEYHYRAHRTGFKAGALDEGMRSATGELIAIFDADFAPPRDFLRRTVDYFTDPNVGVVQTRWTYLNRDYNLLTEVQAMLLDGHFVLEHAARAGRGLFFNFNGTAGVLRRRMIEHAGGWQHDTLTEDSDLSYRAQLKGWKFVYLPEVECPSELPVETYGFQVQQSRWAKGLTQVMRKLLGTILRSNVPARVKLEAFCHLTPNLTYPAMIVCSALFLPVMIVRFYVGWQQLVLVDLPLVIANFFSVIAFYVYAQHERDRRGWKRSILMMPMVIAAGVALTIINTRAVLEALAGYQTGFVRTPKYAITGNQRVSVANLSYRRRSGWLPFLEIVMGTYFLGMVLYSIETLNFIAVPFMTLFLCGYWWAGFSTLYQEHRDRLAWERQRRLELEASRG